MSGANAGTRGGIDKSVPVTRDTPPTKTEGLITVAELRAQLTKKQTNERSFGFCRLILKIETAPATGSIHQYIKSWQTPGTKDIRVDLEVQLGIAFVDG